MGAHEFFTISKGVNAKAAFTDAREQAEWENGHCGYTGTIAEKDKFVMISVPEGVEPIIYANQLMDNDDPRVSDKWGPAGCVKVEEGKYLFFGWASS